MDYGNSKPKMLKIKFGPAKGASPDSGCAKCKDAGSAECKCAKEPEGKRKRFSIAKGAQK